MNKNQFLVQFQLSNKPRTVNDFPYQGTLKPSAVLIPLVERKSQLNIVLTKRASHLTHHAGQICFPGGRFESQDGSLIDTAIRESNEEIGIHRETVKVVGILDDFRTITGYKVTPVVALLDNKTKFIINQDEVDAIFEIPLTFLLNPANIHTKTVSRQGQSHTLYFIPYQSWHIWGATAAMLVNLITHLQR